MSHKRNRSSSCRRSINIDPSNLQLQIALKECEELKETVNFVEYYLVKSKSDNKSLGASLKSSEEYSQELKEKLKSQLKLNSDLNRENSRLQLEIEKLVKTLKNEKESQKVSDTKRDEEKSWLLETIRAVSERLIMANEEIDVYRRTKFLNKSKLISLVEKVAGDWTKLPNNEIQDTERQCDSSMNLCAKIPKLKQEISRLVVDNEKLIKVIQNSPGLEYFTELTLDSGHLTHHKDKVKCRKKNCGANDNAFLGNDWIPLPVYNAVRDFNSLYDDPILNGALNQLLNKLNLAWQKRENIRLDREKARSSTIIKRMRSKSISLNQTPNSLQKTQKISHPRCVSCQMSEGSNEEKPEHAKKIKEKYEDVSKTLEIMIKEYFDIKDRSPTSARRDEECLIVSILGVLGEFTDNLICLVS